MNIKDLRIEVKFVGPQKHQIRVEYNPYTWDHDAWDKDGYLGRIRLRELFFGNYEVVR